MTWWVADESGLRPAQPRLPEGAWRELTLLLDLASAPGELVHEPVALADVAAALGRTLSWPEPDEVVALVGRVDREGRLLGVELSSQTREALLRRGARIWAPHSSNELEALRIGRAHRHSPLIAPLADVSELVTRVTHASLDRREDVRAAQVAETALGAAEPRWIGWAGLHALCLAALRRTTTSTFPWTLRLARDITARHMGRDALIDWPSDAELAQLPPARRLEILAHVVQSAADADGETAIEYAERARTALAPPSHRTAADARLLGAIGRALASGGAPSAALDVLSDALAAWAALGQDGHASYALCELLRIATRHAPETARRALVGARGDEPSPTRTSPRDDDPSPTRGSPPDDPTLGAAARILARTEEPARRFVWLAIGRAFAQLGAPSDAIAALEAGDPSAWELGPRHVRTARWHWLARAHRARDDHGDEDAAARAEQALEALGPSEHRWLTQIERARREGRVPLDELRGLLALPERGAEANRLLQRLAAGWTLENVAADPALVGAVVDEWRY